MKVPEVKRCCFCVPLRHGIIVFGVLNFIASLMAITCLTVTTDLKKISIIDDASLEAITSAVLFSIFGMGAILNTLLLVAGCQKDLSMLRLYSYYAVGMTLAALVPTFILLHCKKTTEVCTAFFAIATQCYVILLVRSEVIKLEKPQWIIQNESIAEDETVCVTDNTLLI